MTYQDHHGRRVSTETAYLTPEVLKRKNLTVSTHTVVTKIIIETLNGDPRATAVEFAREKGQPLLRVKANKEIIVRYVLFLSMTRAGPCLIAV